MLDIKIFTILIVLVSFEYQLVLSDDSKNYCYSEDKHPYLYAATKTAYGLTHGLIRNTTVPNCEAKQIWMLGRHGTRYSGEENIEKMITQLPELQLSIIKNHEQGRGSLCKEDIRNLKAWKLDPNLSTDKKEYLTTQGEEDWRSLGERYRNYFPSLLRYDDSNDVPVKNFRFRSTDSQRTKASMNFFIKGLFGNVTARTKVVPVNEDTLLKIYGICKPWKEIMKDPSTNAEVNAFLTGPEYTKAIHEVSQRLGFEDDLPFDVVLTMHTACVFEKAWNIDKLSPWCAAFTEDVLKIFEYEEDLYYYYHASHGQNMSAKIGCAPLQDMFKRFTKLEGTTKNNLEGTFYFTHSSMVQLFLTSMGIAKDSTPLKASNFETMKDTRKWRTTFLAPFAANFAAVFYSCESSNKIRLFLNEEPLEVEGCKDGVCDWAYLKKKWKTPGFDCNTDFCTE